MSGSATQAAGAAAGVTVAQAEGAARQAPSGTAGNGANASLEQRVNDGLARISEFLEKASAVTRGDKEAVPADVQLRRDTMDRLDKVFVHLNAALMELGQMRSRVGSTQ
jgi:hypothetical protein